MANYPTITSDALPPIVHQEFEDHHAQFEGWASVEHKGDGTHGVIHADRLEVSGTMSGTTLSLSGGLAVAQNEVQSGTVSPSQLTANQDNYNPTNLSIARTLHLSASGAVSITGIAAQAEGFLLRIRNTGSFPITLRNSSASSSGVNQFVIMADTTLSADAVINLQYAAGKWRLA